MKGRGDDDVTGGADGVNVLRVRVGIRIVLLTIFCMIYQLYPMYLQLCMCTTILSQ